MRARCQRQTGSFVTPMGDEMFYRYQELLINEAMTSLRLTFPKEVLSRTRIDQCRPGLNGAAHRHASQLVAGQGPSQASAQALGEAAPGGRVPFPSCGDFAAGFRRACRQ